MDCLHTRFFQAVFLICLLLGTPLSGHAEAPVTTSNAEVASEELDLLLLPLTRDELAVEAEGWRDLLKQSTQAVSNMEIESRQIEGKNAEAEQLKDQKLDQLASLREEKSRLYSRYEQVVDAYEAKGAAEDKVTELRLYGKVASGVTVELSDDSALFAAINGWIMSSEGGIKWALIILKFALIVAVFWVIASIFRMLTHRATSKSQTMSALLKNFLDKFVKRAVLLIGVLIALSSVGVNVSALMALIGGGAFIIGFALQDTLGNFAAGMMLLFYRPFDVGDFVEVGGVAGTVDNVSLVNTTIRSVDNKIILVPNTQVWGEVITNATASSQRRVDLVFGVGYEDDLDQAKAIIEKVLSEHELVLDKPEPVVEVNALGESSVDFVCRPWTQTSDYWRVYWDLTRRVKMEFDKAGISIPFPQRDIHVYHSEQSPEKAKPKPSDEPQKKHKKPM